eukprot:Unigene8403_Nuclearia_a/m.25720 Unigene8403_Nuclearia_a/g.25720  ORF Unigene8403_Nuclearia_a/g.25720 Unigene8403_Nuclearia_a/m.25720 type:complete len:449 (+) Unigene8403_Nuclearia_a:63-1409(+)
MRVTSGCRRCSLRDVPALGAGGTPCRSMMTFAMKMRSTTPGFALLGSSEPKKTISVEVSVGGRSICGCTGLAPRAGRAGALFGATPRGDLPCGPGDGGAGAGRTGLLAGAAPVLLAAACLALAAAAWSAIKLARLAMRVHAARKSCSSAWSRGAKRSCTFGSSRSSCALTDSLSRVRRCRMERSVSGRSLMITVEPSTAPGWPDASCRDTNDSSLTPRSSAAAASFGSLRNGTRCTDTAHVAWRKTCTASVPLLCRRALLRSTTFHSLSVCCSTKSRTLITSSGTGHSDVSYADRSGRVRTTIWMCLALRRTPSAILSLMPYCSSFSGLAFCSRFASSCAYTCGSARGVSSSVSTMSTSPSSTTVGTVMILVGLTLIRQLETFSRVTSSDSKPTSSRMTSSLSCMLWIVASPLIVRTVMSRFGSKFFSHTSNVSFRYDMTNASILAAR